MAPIRIAVVGLGKIAADQHLPAIAANPAFELAAVATKGGVPSGLAAPVAVPLFDDHRAMLREVPGIDAVAVCTPPAARHPVARDALLAGKHVLLEKPTCATLGEAEDLAGLARDVGRTAFATWHSRFNPAVNAARAALAGRQVVRLDVQWREDVERWHPGQDWIWQPGGFGVFDPGINALSAVTAILPDPLFVRACRLLVQPGHDTPIAASLAFGTVHDADLRAEFDWRPSPDIRTITVATGDGLELSLLASARRLLLNGVETATSGDGEYSLVYARFATLIAAGRSDMDLAPLRLVADALLLASRS